MVLRVPTIKKVEVVTVEQVADARQYLADIGNHMAESVTRIRGIRSASQEEGVVRANELKELEDEILAHLNSGEELLANAAKQAYALAMVSTMPADKRLVMETIKGSNSSQLPDLMELGVLELATDDPRNAVTVKVYGDIYKVSGGREFVIKLARALSEGATRAAKAAHDQYHGACAELEAQATISVAEFLARKMGKLFLVVPDATIPNAKAKDGKAFLPGGALLAESNGKMIKVVKSIGHFQRIMTEIAEARTFVSIQSIGDEWLNLADLPGDVFRRVRILHTILRRGFAEAQKGEGNHG